MNILLIDDHPVFRAGLESLLKQLDPAVEVLHAGSCAEGLRAAREHPLNLIFLDLNLPDAKGLAGLGAVKAVRPSVPVVVISGEQVDHDLIEQALDAKAMGFVPKSENADMIVAALRAALAGGVFLPAALFRPQKPIGPARTQELSDQPGAGAGQRLRHATPADLGLTPRQGEVLSLLVQGLPNKRIATRLGISVSVVKKHVSDLLAHFQVVSRTQLVAQIAARGLLLGPPALSDPDDEVTED